MARVIEEAGGLVAPGGLWRPTRPQQSAWNFKGLGVALERWLSAYYSIKRGYHSTREEQAAVLVGTPRLSRRGSDT